jgi:Pyruvate/2-oxoacid:ferredoxin oxidoreductase delta subunit
MMIILSLHQSPDHRLATLQEGVAEQCGVHGLDCLSIPPLYQIAETCAFWSELAGYAKNPVLACWSNPRPAAWLLRRHEIVIEESKIVDLHGFSDAASAFAAIIDIVKDKPAEKTKSKPAKKPPSRKRKELPAETGERWYPILDGSRCVNCGHCLQFCLFGVYELDAEEKVEVRNPDLCKTGCPACARICPQSAIMFPLYENDDAIAGAPNRFVAIDAAARRMFYTRTKQACPVCGCKATRKPPASSDKKNTCPECGGPLREKKSGEKSDLSTERPAFDDLDLLVEQLDRSMRRSSK